ncbi:phage tail protein [Clostridium chromiireducens]|uniref:Phage tail fibre protein N-terminal domain-containing protein n=1 Tax=Clostridium chromiireducens TaxID=225345 RepID=A0A1V4IV58_9CLOT|nr:phage tail protein [Clostridium chromiireducens]OPJ63675.1 hypothetical protein CLCHR_14900 [Clostridium chromiireducens]
MSYFGGLVLTDLGKNLLTKAQAGKQLNYTKVSIGDGALGSSSISSLTALKNKIKDISITKLKVLPTGKAVIGFTISNQNITTGFYFREIGIFATDPDLGEILYCYGNAGTNAEFIPANGSTDVIEKSIDINLLVGNAANVSATIDQSLVYATPIDVNNALTQAKQYADAKINSSSISEVKLTTTSATKILLFTPAQQGNFKIDVYLRVLAASNITVSITYTDTAGVQTKMMIPERNGLYFPNSSGVQSYTIGNHFLRQLCVNALKNTPIDVNITANLANQVYVSALIMGV